MAALGCACRCAVAPAAAFWRQQRSRFDRQHSLHICGWPAGAVGRGSPTLAAAGASGSNELGEAPTATARLPRGPADGRQQRRRKRAGSGLRREDLPFFIARADLTWQQPWRFQQAAPLRELELRRQGVSGLDDAAAAERLAEARFKVELPLGLGALVVKGEVAAAVPLRCELCDAPFEADSLAGVPFDAVVLLEAGGRQADARDLAANELLFDVESESLCDITPLVADAIVSRLPSVALCGGGSCRNAGEVAWRSGPAAPVPASSPFAKLLAVQQQPKQRKKKF